MPAQNLTREEAKERSQVVRQAEYRVILDLNQGDETFLSTTFIDFEANPGEGTFVDLISNYVESIELNGRVIPISEHHDSRIWLPDLEQHNHLQVVARCDYMHTGEGLHRFHDPVDGEDYVYSQFEVPDSRRVFTVFEQPDIKATFQFTVKTPKHWTVFSNSPTLIPTETDDGRVFDFTPTEIISSYITAIVAGPYQGVTGQLTSRDGRTIPLGVYCRASMLEHLDADNILEITRKGFEFYEEEFDFAYPFRKYDQIFVPEYNAGAMENAGCVTFRDSYVFRSKPTQNLVERRAITILHELAHMWFGNLVTMKWWNDLWLNESFAEYMSHVATEKTTEFKEAWTTFSALEKSWAYRQDQLPSTHPIVADIRDLEDVQVNFDGITYAKGACVLSQLVAYVGPDNFRQALCQYFQKHQWSNTVLADLLHELEKASGRDLSTWSAVWLEEAGINLLCPEITQDDAGNIQSLVIHQEAFSAGASLRPHRLVVSGYQLHGQGTGARFERIERVEMELEGQQASVDAFVGKPRPDVILINDEDWAYAKVRLDEQSLECARNHVDAFPASMQRSLILATVWDMVRDAEVSARFYVDLALRALHVERNSTVIGVTLANLWQCATAMVHPDNRQAVREQIATGLWRLARSVESASDAQLQLIRAAAAHSWTDQAKQSTYNIWSGVETLMGLNVDTDLNWRLLVALSCAGMVSEDDIAAALRTDDTVNGRQWALQARAAHNEAQVKQDSFERAWSDQELTNDQLGALIAGYSLLPDPQLVVPLVKQYFDRVLPAWNERTLEMSRQLITGLFPMELVGVDSTVDVVALTEQWLLANSEAPAALRRIMQELQSNAQRIAQAQHRDAAPRA